MKIKNTKVYGLNESIVRSGYPMQVGEPDGLIKFAIADILEEDIDSSKDEKRAKKLSSAPIGSGHDNFLKGIVVQFDLKYPQYFTPQLQRYHWIDIISSQSKMHCLVKISNVHKNCNKYVLQRYADGIDKLIDVYNKDQFPYVCHGLTSFAFIIESKEECFQYIISNLPMGYEMWMGISTNYLQLKTIYNQRKHHKLSDWQEFCQWIETLPMSELITGEQK